MKTYKKVVCHDCGKQLKENDEVMPYKDGEFFKCKECHQKDPVLRNFQETEVYSRVVGYIRPVKQWNKGKQEEYKDRQNFVP
jgi:ribonucleoside-triphosphate reductase